MKIETILFLDGSNLSIYLLNYIIKIKKFEVKYLILSSNCKKKIIERLKKKFKVLTSNLKNPKIIKKIQKFKADILFSYFDFKVPIKILKISQYGGINFHPSYLPYNKGRHSTFWAINNETPFGASSHWVNEKFDEGDIFYQEKIEFLNFENANYIYEKQIKLLKKVIKITLNLFSKKIFLRKIQKKIRNEYHFASDIKKLINLDYEKQIKSYEFAKLIRSTCFNQKTGIFIRYINSLYFINSTYKVKKTNYKPNIKLKISKLFKDINKRKIYKYNIYYKKFKLIITSKVSRKNFL